MATEQQIAANRANAQKSTGPKTPEGRAAVRLNGLKHGLSAETLVVLGEDPADFDALLDSLHAEHQPATPTEVILVRQLAMAAWRQLRLYRMEAGFFKRKDQEHSDRSEYRDLDPDARLAVIADRDAGHKKSLLNFHRFEVRLERSIRTAVQELRRCRAERIAKKVTGSAGCDWLWFETAPGQQIVPPTPHSGPPEEPAAPQPDAAPPACAA